MPEYPGSVSFGPSGGMRTSQAGPSPVGYGSAGGQLAGMDPRGFIQWLLNQRNRANRPAPLLETADSATGLQNRALEAQVEAMELANREALAQYQARTNPMPTRMLYGPNIVPGRVSDPNVMNYYQRQAYLPQDSRIVGGGGESPAALSQGGPLFRPGGQGTGGTNWLTNDPAQAQQLQAGQQAQGLAGQAEQQALAARQYPGLYGRMTDLQRGGQEPIEEKPKEESKPSGSGSIGGS